MIETTNSTNKFKSDILGSERMTFVGMACLQILLLNSNIIPLAAYSLSMHTGCTTLSCNMELISCISIPIMNTKSSSGRPGRLWFLHARFNRQTVP